MTGSHRPTATRRSPPNRHSLLAGTLRYCRLVLINDIHSSLAIAISYAAFFYLYSLGRSVLLRGGRQMGFSVLRVLSFFFGMVFQRGLRYDQTGGGHVVPSIGITSSIFHISQEVGARCITILLFSFLFRNCGDTQNGFCDCVGAIQIPPGLPGPWLPVAGCRPLPRTATVYRYFFLGLALFTVVGLPRGGGGRGRWNISVIPY